MARNSYTFKIEKLTSHIGANIFGLDLKEKLDEETVGALYQAWLDHIVLVFRDCNLTQEEQIRITNYVGRQAKFARPAKYYPP